MLLALRSALRASSIQYLNIDLMANTKSCCKFYFNKLHKSWRRCKAPPAVIHQEYTHDESSCVVRVLGEYIVRKEKWGSGEEHSQLLLSFIHPDKPVASSAVPAWLKAIFMKSGVDTGNFNAHSNRSASISKAGLQGALIQDNLKWASWSNESTLRGFYNKDIVEAVQIFQEIVFNSA